MQLLIIIVVAALLLALVQMGLTSLLFAKLGLSPAQGSLLLISSLIGSVINLPLLTIKATAPDDLENIERRIGLMRMAMPPFEGITAIMINVGGCLIPLVFSASLIARFPLEAVPLLITTAICTAVCYFTSRPVPGIGIAMMPLIPPIAAAGCAIIFGGPHAAPIAYIAGTLGVLLGADLLRMRDIAKLGTPIAAIGGAGTFDGIFLTGIIAVLLT